MFVASGSSVDVYGTLAAGTAAPVDFPADWSSTGKVLRSADSGTSASLSDYASGVPAGKFTLGNFINMSSPCTVTAISGTKQWSADGTGGLAGRRFPATPPEPRT